MTAPSAPKPTVPDIAGEVTYRVLPLGAGKIFSGEFDAARNRFTTLNKGDRASAPRAVAEALQARGFAEIT